VHEYQGMLILAQLNMMHDAHEKYINHVLIMGANDNSIYHDYSAAVG